MSHASATGIVRLRAMNVHAKRALRVCIRGLTPYARRLRPLRIKFTLLSEKYKRRSEPLNPWSCGLGRFRRFAAIVGNGIPSPGITETRLKTSFSQKDGFGCV